MADSPLGRCTSHTGVPRSEPWLCFWFSFLLMHTRGGRGDAPGDCVLGSWPGHWNSTGNLGKERMGTALSRPDSLSNYFWAPPPKFWFTRSGMFCIQTQWCRWLGLEIILKGGVRYSKEVVLWCWCWCAEHEVLWREREQLAEPAVRKGDGS